MSVFEPGSPEDPFVQLVGEGKKFKDQSELAKGKLEADNYIETLKADLEATKLELEVQKRLAEARPNPLERQPAVEAHQPAQPTNLTPEALAELVKTQIAALNKDQVVQNNVNTVATKLLEIYGDETKANQVVKQKAQELGVSVEFLQSVAAQSPKAFFQQIGLDSKSAAPPPAPRSDVNTQAMDRQNTVQAGTYKHYRQMMKDNPKLQTNADFQMQMHNDALRLGDAFFE